MKFLDTILVVDVESTCWPSKPPEGELSEIIEIGYVEYQHGKRLVFGQPNRGASIFVKPQYSTISKFCTELNGITQEQANLGITFSLACDYMVTRLQSKKRVWASYGDYDRKQFQRECLAKMVPYPFGDSHINVKTLFALKYGLDKEVGMAEALKLLGMTLDGRHHSGMDDAYNITKILAWIIGK